MQHRSRTGLLVIVTAVVMAFALGSMGTASAGGLTKSVVKRIATKVVKKQAPTLSVAHASTADSATTAATLQGSTADSLKTHSFTYVLPAETPASIHHYSFPGLPIGTYFVTYSYNAQVQGTNPVIACQIEATTNTTPYTAVSYGDLGLSGFNRASSTGVLTTTPTTDLLCVMVAGTSYNFVPSNVVDDSVTFIPIGIATRTNSTSTRPGAIRGATAGSGLR